MPLIRRLWEITFRPAADGTVTGFRRKCSNLWDTTSAACSSSGTLKDASRRIMPSEQRFGNFPGLLLYLSTVTSFHRLPIRITDVFLVSGHPIEAFLLDGPSR